MKLVSGIFAFAALLMLAGCAGWGARNAIDTLNRAQPVGSPYTVALAQEYRALANMTQGRFINSADALHFARKGLAAVDGLIVMPEVVDDWNLNSDALAEVTYARSQLVTLLDNGGRDTSPEKAAIAQSRFDCWLMEEEHMWSKNGSCKSQFYSVMTSLANELSTAAPPPVTPAEGFPAPITDAAKGEPVPIQQAAFMVFFDWDKYNLSNSAKSVLDVVAGEVKSRKDVKGVVVVGHTDTSGSEKYNNKLSMKRANAVRDALISRSFPAEKIRVEGRGETDLLVKTPDNVREPENRRAQITLE